MLNYISANVVAGIDQSETQTLEKAITDVLSGLVVFFVDGADLSWSYGVQAFLREVSTTHNPRFRKRAHTRDLPRALRITSHFCEEEYALPF